MRCKICLKPMRLSNKQRNAHHWEYQHCARCHYLGWIRAFPNNFPIGNTFAKQYWAKKKEIKIEPM